MAQAYFTPSHNTGADPIFATPDSGAAPQSVMGTCQRFYRCNWMRVYEARPRKDKRGVGLVSDGLATIWVVDAHFPEIWIAIGAIRIVERLIQELFCGQRQIYDF